MAVEVLPVDQALRIECMKLALGTLIACNQVADADNLEEDVIQVAVWYREYVLTGKYSMHSENDKITEPPT